MASVVPCVAVRGSTGICVNHGPPNYELVSAFSKDESKNCKAMLFSPEGEYFAWLNGKSIKIASTKDWKVITEIPRPKGYQIEFSPKGTYIISWEQFAVTKEDAQGTPNLNIYKTATGELVKAYIQRKNTNWAPQFTTDESICVRQINSDILFHNVPDFEKVVSKVVLPNVFSFSLSPEKSPFHLACYLVGKGGQPSAGRLFQYPNIDPSLPIANKSFFQADKVDMLWNSKGNGVLLLASTEVDKTNTSYYGKQSLHFLSTKGETASVILGKEGPIYAVQWSPVGTEFCVVYGFMPSKATMYNFKCESVFEFGVAPRNTIHFNPQGNILLLGGFGNLSGNVETWDVKSRKVIAKLDAPDTTLLHWSPNGEHFMTATTAPRLRIGNGFRIWHYSGALLYERPWNKQEELWEVLWQKFPSNTFKTPAISYKPVEGIQSSVPLPSKQAYVPPSQRGKDDTTSSNFRKDVNGDITPFSQQPTKNALKYKKRRENKKSAKQNADSSEGNQQTPVAAIKKPKPESNGTSGIGGNQTNKDDVDVETLKKIKKLRVSIKQIQALKEQKKAGQQLQPNQISKLEKENDLVKELNALLL